MSFFKKRIFGFFIFSMFIVNGCMTTTNRNEVSIDKNIQRLMDNSVFEVVIPKPVKDSLTYEKKLPWHLVPFSMRNDKYFSIGTAFAIGSNRFISAAHVINVRYRSQFEKVYIRNKAGKVYELNQVYKYSNHKDFILFSVKGNLNVKTPFKLSNKSIVNEPVLAVGNALGEGIIARKGMLTSKTSEEEKGEWKWLRFSAAASPGNSGGPLLNAKGEAIGIVLRKSANENLNYALPVSELSKNKNIAINHILGKFTLLNMTEYKNFTYDAKVKLPKNYLDLRKVSYANYNADTKRMHKSFLKEHRANIFPAGEGSKEFLHSNSSYSFPGLICQSKSGEWSDYYPSDTKTVKLKKNGSVTYGVMSFLVVSKLNYPDNVSMKKMLMDPKAHMDLLLKGIPYNRYIGRDGTRVTSIGKAYESFIHVDDYKRKWIVSSWLTEYDDKKLVAFTLPLPGGTYTMIIHASTYKDFMPDLKYLANYIHLSYYGTFSQWREFLNNKKYLPEGLSKIKFSYVKNSKVNFKFKEYGFHYDKDFMTISDKSDMGLGFSYFMENKKAVWDISIVSVSANKNDSNSFSISRENKPVEGLSDNHFAMWERISKSKYPYDGKPYLYKGSSFINVISKVANNRTYALGLEYEGEKKDEFMKKKITDLKSMVKFYK